MKYRVMACIMTVITLLGATPVSASVVTVEDNAKCEAVDESSYIQSEEIEALEETVGANGLEEVSEDGIDYPMILSPYSEPYGVNISKGPASVKVFLPLWDDPNIMSVVGTFTFKSRHGEGKSFSQNLSRVSGRTFGTTLYIDSGKFTDGSITFSQARVCFYGGTSRTYSVNGGSMVKLNIYIEGGDSTPPKASGIDFNTDNFVLKTKAKTMKINLKASDNSKNISKIVLKLTNGQKTISFKTFKKKSSSEYILSAKIPIDQELGTYKVKSIYLQDGVGNYKEYKRSNLPSAIKNAKVDITRENILYNIVFKANGGTGSMDRIKNVVGGTTIELPKNTFKRSGYKFAGWNTEIDGTGVAYDNKALVQDLTDVDGATVKLYAQWEQR